VPFIDSFADAGYSLVIIHCYAGVTDLLLIADALYFGLVVNRSVLLGTKYVICNYISSDI